MMSRTIPTCEMIQFHLSLPSLSIVELAASGMWGGQPEYILEGTQLIHSNDGSFRSLALIL